jgi:Lantibiotic dehydratase, N terminus
VCLNPDYPGESFEHQFSKLRGGHVDIGGAGTCRRKVAYKDGGSAAPGQRTVSTLSREKTILMPEEDIPRQTDRPPVVRSAGLPILSLTALRCVKSMHEISELTQMRTRLGSEGAELAEALFPVIGTLTESPARPVLVGLRRALHQSRTPAEREWNPQVASVLPAVLCHRIGDWAYRLSEWRRKRDELPAILAEEQRQERARLREALMHPGLQRALSQSAPTLLDEARRWIADERRAPQRQKLFRLAKYVSRAAAKTSPYSTFMINSFGVWGDNGPAIRFNEPQEPHGVLELNGHYLEAVRLALARRAELARGIRVRVNPSATQRDGELRFLGVRPAESIVTFTVTPALRACLSLFDHGVPTMAGLREQWRSTSGAGRASDRFLDRLVAAGLLEPYVPVSDHAEDWLGQVQEWVELYSGGRVPPLVKVLGQVRDELHRDVPVADVEEHLARQRALHTALGELADTLELDRVIVGDSPGAAFHEVAVVGEPVAVCSREQWAPALHDLDVLRRFLAIFDFTLPLRLAMGSYVRERFGSGARVEFVVLHSAVQEELGRVQCADPPGTDTEADLRVLFTAFLGKWDHRPRLALLQHLQQLRAQARELLLGEPDSDGVVRVDPGVLSASVASRPAWITAPAVVDCYVQVRSSEAGLGLVLNLMTRGHGRGSSRLRRFVALAGGVVPPDECDSHGLRLAELSGMLGWTLNVRAPSVRYEIDYPFTVSARQEAECLPLSDLTIVHDPAHRPGRGALHQAGVRGHAAASGHADGAPASPGRAVADRAVRRVGPVPASVAGAGGLGPHRARWACAPPESAGGPGGGAARELGGRRRPGRVAGQGGVGCRLPASVARLVAAQRDSRLLLRPYPGRKPRGRTVEVA